MAGTSTPYERTPAAYHQSRQPGRSAAAPGPGADPRIRFQDKPGATRGPVRSELFGAPSRESRYDAACDAHSFLRVSPDAALTRHVQAITDVNLCAASRDSLVIARRAWTLSWRCYR